VAATEDEERAEREQPCSRTALQTTTQHSLPKLVDMIVPTGILGNRRGVVPHLGFPL